MPGEVAIGKAKVWCTRFITRLLLFAYALFVLKPVMPILIDNLAHTFWKNVHIAVVHKVNGKEHVHYELARAAKDLDKEKSGGKVKTETEQSSYLIAAPIPALKAVIAYYIPEKYRVFSSLLPDSFQEHDYPPPKC